MMQSDERGAVLVHVAILIIALLAFTAFTFDMGVKWVSRAQAQNSADAGALAGAVALSFDNPNDLTDTGPAKQSAYLYTQANAVWGQSPDVNISTDITFPACPDGSPDLCVKADVYRTAASRGAGAKPLPTFFANLLGIAQQGVRATATAQVRTGNATDCLKPWAVVDRWAEYVATTSPTASVNNWDPSQTFDKYRPCCTGPLPRYEPDVYVPPSASSSGTGWTVDPPPLGDYGRQFGIKTDAPGNTTVSSGWFRALDLPRTDTSNLGGNAYGANITTCSGYPVAIADPALTCPAATSLTTFADKVYWASQGCVRVQTGVIQGQTISGIDDIYNRDPNARWDPTLNGKGGVVNSDFDPSPRIVPVAVMDIDQYLAPDPSGSGGVVKIVNIFGFFIEGMGDIDSSGNIIFDPSNPLSSRNKVVVGRLMTIPGVPISRSPITSTSSFLRTIVLVR
jgi:Flp pilus assembly protein TadG